MIDITNTPSVFNEKGRNPKMVSVNALKDIHLSFSGYGIQTGEKVTFPTSTELQQNPTKYIKILDTYAGSTNKGALILVERNNGGKKMTDWFNLSILTRQAVEADGTRINIDSFRENMRAMPSDAERVQALLGKTLVGSGTLEAYAPEFSRETRKPTGNYIEASYVTIDVEEAAPTSKKK